MTVAKAALENWQREEYNTGRDEPMILRSGSRKGCSTRKRERRTVKQIYDALGPYYFRRAYRMSYGIFLKLYDKLLPYLVKASGYRDYEKAFYIHNGKIPLSVRLACAIRYFAGGSAYDIVCKYGISHTDVYVSVWMVVDAINMHPDFAIKFPDTDEEQEKVAEGFKKISSAGIDCCAGAVDGILIWIKRPSAKDCKETGCDAMKFLCGRKEKFGLNCQAVCDARGKFLDMSIMFPGSTSDCLAFEGSTLYRKLENGLLKYGLCLFGDNAYINSRFMATPYPGRTSTWHDSYNFYHSQIRIRIECAFGIFVQRWGLLRSAIPNRINVAKTTSLVLALAKLHNFCIDAEDGVDVSVPTILPIDEDNIELRGRVGAVPLVSVEHAGNQVVPRDLMDGGNHFDDVNRNELRRIQRQLRNDDVILPREQLRHFIECKGLERPTPIPRRH